MPATRTIAPPPSGEQWTINHGDQIATVVEVGGGLRTYDKAGGPVLLGYGEQEMCEAARGQVLVPWPNRVDHGRYSFQGREQQLPIDEVERGTAIHGLVRWSSWHVVHRLADRVTVGVTLHPQPGYPHTVELQQEYALSQRGLGVRMSAVNRGDMPCPFGAGMHPYVTAGTELLDSATLTVPAAAYYPTDERGIPLGRQPVEGSEHDFRAGREIGPQQVDVAYTDLERDGAGLARAVLAAPDGRWVELWQDAAFPYVEVFTADTVAPERRRRGLGLEPMTCAPNAFRSGDGLRTLSPGETFVGSWGVAVHPAGETGSR